MRYNWVLMGESKYVKRYKCPKCGYEIFPRKSLYEENNEKPTNYCANCGKKMINEDN